MLLPVPLLMPLLMLLTLLLGPASQFPPLERHLYASSNAVGADLIAAAKTYKKGTQGAQGTCTLGDKGGLARPEGRRIYSGQCMHA